MLDAAAVQSRPRSVQLGELVGDVETRSPARHAPDEAFTYIDLSAINQEQKFIEGARTLAGREAPSRARQVVKTGDVLVSTVRPNLNGVALVTKEYDGAIASTGFCVLRPCESRLDPSFLFHWVRTETFIASMVQQATGASYPAVTDRIVRESLIPAPSPAEQSRIAAILDQADALRAKRRAALARLDEMARATFVEMFGRPDVAPSRWPTKSVNDICTRLTVGHVGPMVEEYQTSGVPWLRSLNVRRNRIDVSDVKFVSDKFHQSLKKSKLYPGDVVTVRTGRPGVTAVIPETLPEANCADLIVMSCSHDIIPEYLSEVLNIVLGDCERVQGVVGAIQSHFNIGVMRQLRIPCPPRELQTLYREHLTVIEKLSTAQAEHLRQSENLFTSLQHRAFRGEL